MSDSCRVHELIQRIGYLDQLRPLYAGFRVREMLTLGRRLNPRWDDRAARDRLVELRIPMDQKLRRLSVGHQAQVAMALCLGKSPDLLLLDEPAANLDPLARQQLLSSLMERVEAHRTTVVLSSHIIGELESVATT